MNCPFLLYAYHTPLICCCCPPQWYSESATRCLEPFCAVVHRIANLALSGNLRDSLHPFCSFPAFFICRRTISALRSKSFCQYFVHAAVIKFFLSQQLWRVLRILPERFIVLLYLQIYARSENLHSLRLGGNCEGTLGLQLFAKNVAKFFCLDRSIFSFLFWSYPYVHRDITAKNGGIHYARWRQRNKVPALKIWKCRFWAVMLKIGDCFLNSLAQTSSMHGCIWNCL